MKHRGNTRAALQACKSLRSTIVIVVSALLLFDSSAIRAAEQGYPNRPVRLVLPYAPGGALDVITRLLAQKLSENLGQQVVVDNRAGADGIIASVTVAKANPDGYTLLLGAVQTHAVNPAMHGSLPYDQHKDFAPISLATTYSYILLVHPSVDEKSVKELIALAKSKPGALNYSTGGAGTGNHLAGELFKVLAGVDMAPVHYKGGGPAVTDLVGAQVSLMFSAVPTALPYIRNNRLRALGITSLQRSSLAPDLPTIAESGVLGYEVASWSGVLAPAKTPQTLVRRLNSEIGNVLQRADIKQRLLGMGAEPVTSTPEEFAAYIRSESAKWAKVISASGMRRD